MSHSLTLETIQNIIKTITDIENETIDYKKILRKKMSNINRKIFRKRSVDACCKFISEKLGVFHSKKELNK
jgi:hypothetical protein